MMVQVRDLGRFLQPITPRERAVPPLPDQGADVPGLAVQPKALKPAQEAA
jgi:hypothetical protein